MGVSTWTIDDVAPLGVFETAKSAAVALARGIIVATRSVHRVGSAWFGRFSSACINGVHQARRALWVTFSTLSAEEVAVRARHHSSRAASRKLPNPGPVLDAVPTARAIDRPIRKLQPVERRQMDAEEHWQRCVSIIVASVARARASERHQAAALQQIDLAQYGLSSVKIELSAVMSVPGFEAKAQLHHLRARPADGKPVVARVAA